MERAVRESRLCHQARGLPNRCQLESRTGQLVAENKPYREEVAVSVHPNIPRLVGCARIGACNLDDLVADDFVGLETAAADVHVRKWRVVLPISCYPRR